MRVKKVDIGEAYTRVKRYTYIGQVYNIIKKVDIGQVYTRVEKVDLEQV